MNVITIVVLIFSIIGAIDYLIGNKLGMGEEFERAFLIFRPMMLSMLGMLIVAPAIGVWLMPMFEWFYECFGIDPSIIPATLFANDMGGVSLAMEVCKSEEMGAFNGLIVSSMMGCVISYTIPLSIGVVKKERHRDLFFGMLCGIITIPVGCVVAGLMCGLSLWAILLNLLPLLLLSAIIAAALILFTNICIKIFAVFGFAIRAVAIIGLMCAIFTFLSGIEISPHFDKLENSVLICVNVCITLSGALPAMYVIAQLLNRPMRKWGAKMGIDTTSAVALLTTMVTNTPIFAMMEKMNKKGVVLTSAFAVSGAFIFGSHMAYTLACDESYMAPMMIGKLISGVCAVVLALMIYKDDKKQG